VGVGVSIALPSERLLPKNSGERLCSGGAPALGRRRLGSY
jgi:hypothetical protein